jgi:hypothetical protein
MKEKFYQKSTKNFYRKFTEFLNFGGGYALFVLALVAIAFAIIGFHGQHGFNVWWFVFFEMPLYVFCGWALWKAMAMYRKTLDNKKK